MNNDIYQSQNDNSDEDDDNDSIDDIKSLMNKFYNVNIHQNCENDIKNNISDNNSEQCLNLNCSSINFVLDECNYICTSCGTLQDKYIDTQAEWRFYGHNDTKTSDPTRCGMATSDLFPEFSLGSVIEYKYTKNFNDMKNLSKYQRWSSTSYKERSLYTIVDNIYVKANNCGISDSIIEESKALYKKLSEKSLVRGINRQGLIASCVYWSCKANNVPRSVTEISKMFNIETTTLSRGSKILANVMQLSAEIVNSTDFILRFCSNLNLTNDIVQLCSHIVKKTEEYSLLDSNNPPSIAAGAIYLSCVICHIDITKKDIADLCMSSAVTINKCFKTLFMYRAILLPPDIILKYSVK
jgi:transcription initiation factor TFIIB